MRRREFITLFADAAVWPLTARAQQSDRVRRIGVLVGGNENDPERKTRLSALTQALAGFGWTNGRNVRIDLRGAAVTPIGYERSRKSWSACNDIILTNTTPGARPCSTPSILLRAAEVIE
jgi:putative ABC transport system substrate-binding protein